MKSRRVLSLFRAEGFTSAAVIGQMQAGAARITVDYRLLSGE